MAKRSMAKKKTAKRKKAAPARKTRKAMKTSAKRSSKKTIARKVAPKRRAMAPKPTAPLMLPVEQLIKPVHLGSTGAAVSNLHKALQFLIMHEPGISNKDRHTLQGELAPDLQNQTFGQGTLGLVKTWQEQLNLLQNGDVDQTTANALNGLLRQLGAPPMMGGTHGSGGGPND